MTIDVLGEPYTAETIPLPDDHEGPVVATLVHRAAPSATRRAVLHVHGFADYFFQTEYAQWWTDRGYDFYAVDLPKYGRSMLPHQTPNFTTDLRDYYPVLDDTVGRPYGLYVHGNLGLDGAVRAVESVTEGLKWNRVAATVEVTGAPTKADLEACWELGATVAATRMEG